MTQSKKNTKKKDRIFCSINTPFSRRLETAAVTWQVSCIFIFAIFSLFVLANPLLLFTIFFPYLIYYVFDRTPVNGGVVRRYSKFFRSLKIWKYYCNYFPIKLYKTCDLKPTFTPQNELVGPKYIFGYHPHGICALGSFGAISTEGVNWSLKFPGIPTCLMTLVNVFNIPFYRDYLLGLGVTAVSRQNAIKVLKQNYSICIVIGGAQESLHAKVHKAELILDKRKGFVKLALEVGNVGLVPIFAFGENEIYNVLSTENKSLTRRFQLWMKNRWGFTIPLFYARGIFNYDWGFIPFRHPINLVFGNPIMVPKLENFSEKDVDNYHGLYVKELSRIFNEYKAKFGYNDVELELVA